MSAQNPATQPDLAAPETWAMRRSSQGAILAMLGALFLIPGLLLTVYGIKALGDHQMIGIVLGPFLSLVGLVFMAVSCALFSCTPTSPFKITCCRCHCMTRQDDEHPIYSVDTNVIDMYMPTVNDDCYVDTDMYSRYVQNSGLPVDSISGIDLQPTCYGGVPVSGGGMLNCNGTITENRKSFSDTPVVLRVEYEGYDT